MQKLKDSRNQSFYILNFRPCRDHLALDVKNRHLQKTLSGRALLEVLYSKINQPKASVTTERRKKKSCIELPDLWRGMATWKNLYLPLKPRYCKDMKNMKHLIKGFLLLIIAQKRLKNPKE